MIPNHRSWSTTFAERRRKRELREVEHSVDGHGVQEPRDVLVDIRIPKLEIFAAPSGALTRRRRDAYVAPSFVSFPVGGRVKAFFDRLLTVLSVLALLVMGYALLRPGGMVREGLRAWLGARRVATALRERWPELIAAGDRMGDSGGRVVAVEFADYQCPYCRKFAPVIDSILAGNDSISIVYVHLPLSIHPAAEGAARASVCASEQGRFREMHRELMGSNDWERDTNWTREAVRANVRDTALFARCLHSTETGVRLQHDRDLGAMIGAVGTPTFATPKSTWAGAVLPDHFWINQAK